MSANAPSAVRYALSGDISIAYQVLGSGLIDVLMVPGFPSLLDVSWQQPRIAHFYRRLASCCRLIKPPRPAPAQGPAERVARGSAT